MGVRAAYGVPGYRLGLLDVVLTVAVLTMTMGTISIAFRARVRAGDSVSRAMAFATMVSCGVLTVVYVGYGLLRRQYPSLVELEAFAPDSLDFQIVTALADGIPVVMLWAAALLYPAALRSAEDQLRSVEGARREAELLRLRSNLEPHFVLNTLNTIAGLVGRDPHAARRLIGVLGDLFRDATHDAREHSLREEFAWLQRYSQILEARYGDVIAFEWKLGDTTAAIGVPRLLLQPLVENAVAHGALPRGGGGVVKITAYCAGDSLIMEVWDNGKGFSTESRRIGARGLEIAERRAMLEAPGSQLDVERREGWTVVSVSMPLRGSVPALVRAG
ncbi:sensor histidine kinase [Sandaracinus amylolyticus]|uniref:sensor histidine kinase n=1 Tax=Sandaracinus amylolyticus TaxID=927083 RepID=UPI001F3C9E7E|nr:histidine kinase [Sandaracinus amylolyticus]